MFLFYTKSSLNDYESFDLRGGMFLCKEDIATQVGLHQECCDGEVDYEYYALDPRLFELWRFSNDEWIKVGLPYPMQIQEVA